MIQNIEELPTTAVPTAMTIEDVVAQIAILTQTIASYGEAIQSNKNTLDFKEAAVFLGIADSFLYKLTSAQAIPHYKPGGKKIYFDKTELETWVRKGRVSSLDEINAKASNHIVKAG